MSRAVRVVLWAYIAFNLLIAVTLVASPEVIDTTYRGGTMTPTRQFQWFSIATFHLFIVGVTYASMSMVRAAARRRIHLINGAFYLWDAITQLVYWGDVVGLSPTDLSMNAGVSTGVGLVMLAVWWADRSDVTPRS